MRGIRAKALGPLYVFFILFLVFAAMQIGIITENQIAVQRMERISTDMMQSAGIIKAAVLQTQDCYTDASATRDKSGMAEEIAECQQDFQDSIATLQNADPVNASVFDKLTSDYESLCSQGENLVNAYLTQGIQAGNALMQGFDATSEEIESSLESYLANCGQSLGVQQAAVSRTALKTYVVIGAFTIFMLLIIIGAGQTVRRNIIAPVFALQKAMDGLTQGNLHQDILHKQG